MTTFCLVHGAWHGAWSWDLLEPELRGRGHRVIAIDLPVEDATAGCQRYADLVLESLAGQEQVALVGHSQAGLILPLVAAARPIALMIFLSAMFPTPGESFLERMRTERDIFLPNSREGQIRHEDGRTSWPADVAIARFYHDCPPEVGRWAAAQLRLQAGTPLTEISPLEAWPDTPGRAILCTDDRVLSAEWLRRVSVERLGRAAIELPGGHSPFLSRPAHLAEVLIDCLREI